MFLNVLISSPSTANTLWIESNKIIVRLTVNGHLFTYPAVFSIPYVDFLLAINTVGQVLLLSPFSDKKTGPGLLFKQLKQPGIKLKQI